MSTFLVGEKVSLRALERDDAAAIGEWFGRAEVRRGTRQYRPKPLQLHEEYLARVTASESDIQFGIVLAEDGRLVGSCGLHHIDPRNRHAELGLVIGAPADWRRGLGAEASRLLVRYGFDTVNLNRIWLEVFEDNPAARRIYEKIGFRVEGTLRQHSFREGRWWGVLVMGLLADEWRSSS